MLDCWGNFREWDRGSLKTCSCQFLENEFLWQCILNLLGRDFQSFMTLVKYSDINLGMKWISFVSRLQSKTFIFLANYTYSQIPFEQKVIFLVILNFLVYFYYQRSWYKPSIKCHVHLINMSRTSIILSKSLFEESKIISFHNLTFVWVCGDADNNTCVLLINADNVNKSYFYISKLFKLQYHRLYFIIWVGVFIITGYTSPIYYHNNKYIIYTSPFRPYLYDFGSQFDMTNVYV